MRQIQDALERPETTKDDMMTIFLALQRQNFVLGNNLKQLIAQWNKPQDLITTVEAVSNLGISLETKD